MFDVDALGRHEAELLREEAARIADTETALQSVLDGDVLVPLVAHREAPPRRAVTRRPLSMRRRITLLVGVAAAVVAIALVATRDDATPADQPAPTVTVPPTTPARPLPNTDGLLAPGTYFVDQVSGTSTPRIFASLGVGWSGTSDDEWSITKREISPFDYPRQGREIGYMAFSQPVAVYSDACHWEAGNYTGPLTTLAGLVAALNQQQGWVEVTTPSDISIDGYVGKAFQRTAPADMSDCSTRFYATRVSDGRGTYPDFRSWENPFMAGPMGGQYYEPGEIETLWVVDIDGTIVVISTAAWPKPSAGASADFAADVLDSIRIARA
jgi:hypothetical protein